MFLTKNVYFEPTQPIGDLRYRAWSLPFDTFSLHLEAMETAQAQEEDKAMEKLIKDEDKEKSSNTDVARVTFDDILSKLGEFGLEQKLIFVMFSLPTVMSAMQLLGWVFVGANMPHRCRLPEEVGLENATFSYINDSLWESNSCSRTKDNITTACDDGWVYDRSQVEDSVVSAWDLVCNREGLRATVGAAPQVGYLVGAFVFGFLTDKIGRKPTFMISNTLMATGGLLGAAAPEYFTFVIARILTGFAIAGIENACFAMVMELVGPNKRTLAGLLFWFFETTGLLSAVTLAFMVRNNWRLLQAIYSAPALLFLAYWWVAPESVRWLVARGRNTEARNLIHRAARRNGVTISDKLIGDMEQTIERELQEESEEKSSSKTYTAVDLFRFPNLRYKTIILLLCWLTCASLYYVLLLDQSELSDDKYLGFLITAGVQLPGYVYVIFTLDIPAFGRKKSMCGFLILSGLALSSHPFVPESYPAVRITLSIIGRFAANCSYTILNLFSAEQFPTVVRGVGMGFAVVFSRIGTMLAPYILLLGPYSPCIFGFSALLSGLCALLLPETLGRQLPETLQDGERIPICTPWRKATKYSEE